MKKEQLQDIWQKERCDLDYVKWLENKVIESLKKSQWISVKDRLPTEEEANNTIDCIVVLGCGTSQTSWYNCKEFSDYDESELEGFSYYDVVLWQPLPKPPKE